jgi:flagellar hook-basal body protein
MVFGALYSGLSGLTSQSNAISMIGDNVANNTTVGFKKREADFMTIVTNANSSTSYSSGGVAVNTRRMIDKVGVTQSTGNAMDLAINGQGMFVVNSKPDGQGEFQYTRAGSFRQDERGNFINAAGMVLMAWQLDNEGRLPGEPGNLDTVSSALLQSLVPVNFKSISGSAVGTTLVDVGITLNAEAKYIKGAGEVLGFPRGTASNNNNIAADDLIVPSDVLTAGRIKIGDSIAIKTTPPGIEIPFTYGGIAISNDITTTILGASSPSLKFSGAASNDTFRITFGDSVKTFRYKSDGLPNAGKGEFQTLETLATAINSVPGLKAKISANRLHIGTSKGTDPIKFTDLAGTFTSALGLQDIPAAQNRFSTINGLKDIMNKAEGLAAVDSGSGGIDFYTEKPTGTLQIHGITARNTIDATSTSIDNTTLQTSKIINITSESHGLQIGDYVRIDGFTGANGASLPNGVYMVTSIPSGNQFTLNSITSATGAAAPAIAAGTSFTWTKAPGVTYTSKTLPNPNVTGVLPNLVTIADATHSLQAGDVIYVSGYNNGVPGVVANVPDGYYRVASVNALADFTIEADSATAAGPVALGHALDYKKVGVGTPGALNTTPIYTQNGLNTVRVYMPNHGMSANKIFTFKDIPGTPPVTLNNINFDNENTFIVQGIGTDPTYGDYFEYTVENNSNNTGFSGAGFTGVSINEYTKLFTEMGLDQLNFNFGPSYEAGGATGKNLAGGGFSDNSIYTRPLSIYDSLGVLHNFRLAFAKLDNNVWAVEIYAAKAADSSFDIITNRTDGQIAAGKITFNGDGSLATVDNALLNPIEINWMNQALPSNVRFNWGTAGVPLGTAGATVFGKQDGMRQVASQFDQRFLDQNGVQPGLLTGIKADKDGYLIASFSNGGTKKIFRVPIAQFTNYNGLTESTGNSYSESNLSGSFNLRTPGTGGVGEIAPEALEKSNAELSEELTKLIVAQKSYQANAKIISVAKELLDTLDRNV